MIQPSDLSLIRPHPAYCPILLSDIRQRTVAILIIHVQHRIHIRALLDRLNFINIVGNRIEFDPVLIVGAVKVMLVCVSFQSKNRWPLYWYCPAHRHPDETSVRLHLHGVEISPLLSIAWKVNTYVPPKLKLVYSAS